MTLPGRRWLNLAAAAFCAVLVGYALYQQHVVGLEPCHLCIFQRVAVMAAGAVFLLAGLHHPGAVGARVYGVLAALGAAGGMAVAGRHVWIQLQPPGSVPACGAPLDVLFDVLPFQEVVLKVLRGGGECQKVDWTFLGLSMPMWLLAVFAGLLLWALWVNFRREPLKA